MKIIFKIKILIKILIIISYSSLPSLAERVSLNKVSDYINGLTTLQADFEQINSDGSIDTGRLYIRRPGRMRLEYTAPNNALVLAGAGSVAIFDDTSKNGPTLFPLKKTPLNLLLKKNVDLHKNEMITKHTEKDENTFIVAKDPNRKSQGSIKIVFSNSPVSLQGWTITNQSNQKTKIILNKLDKKTKIPLYLFNISAASKNKN